MRIDLRPASSGCTLFDRAVPLFRAAAATFAGTLLSAWLGAGSAWAANCSISTTPTPADITVGGSVDFSGTVSGKKPVTYDWTFNGGSPGSATTQAVTVTYNATGSFQAILDGTDGKGGTCQAQVTVNVTAGGANQPPVANDDNAVTDQDTPVVINVVANDTDADGSVDATTVAIVSDVPAADGSTTNNGDGTVTYTPAAGFTGATSFTYTVDDDQGATSNVATVSITVNATGGGAVSINSTSANNPGGPPANPVPEQPLVTNPLYQVMAVNDLGMHCGDMDTRVASILPPFNVLHAQVVQRGVNGTPQLLDETTASVFYSAASNPNDPVLALAPILAGDGSVYKTNFWDVVNIGAYDPFYPPVVTPLSIPLDLGLLMPDVERLYLGDGQLAADQQAMPSATSHNPFVIDPYVANEPQHFEQYVGTLPFFINFPFGYTAEANFFEAAGVPIAAFDDFGRENPYPLMRVQAEVGGSTVASIDTVVPISGEADCQACHAAAVDGGNGSATQTLIDNAITVATSVDDPQEGGAVPLLASVEWASDINILRLHDFKHGTTLETAADPVTGTLANPVVCQTCHYTPALDLAQVGPKGPPDPDANGRDQLNHKSMSNVMHAHHGQFTSLFPVMPPPDDPQRTSGPPVNDFENTVLEETCYRCHPGNRTQCLRGAMFNAGILCQDCHGDMAQVGDDFTRNVSPSNPGAFELAADFYTNPATPRVPWANEPGCGSCHTGDALNNLAGDNDVIPAADGIRLLQAYRVGDAKATPIVPANKRFAEDEITLADNPGDPGALGNPKLYRVSTGGTIVASLGSAGDQKSGHGGLLCESCHGSTHAEWPNANPDANDNVAANQLQGHGGTIIECTTCHEPNDSSLPMGLEGPHGMHPIVSNGDTRWNFQHKNYGGSQNNNCRTCHGTDLKGTVLSRAADDRLVACKNTQGTLDCQDDGQGNLVATISKGSEVTCGMCHKQKR